MKAEMRPDLLGKGLFFAAILIMFGALQAAGGEGIAVGPEVALLPDGPGQGLQATPSVAFGKDIYLVVWREGWHGEGGKARIYAARMDKSGKALDPKGIEVAPSEGGVQTLPRVAFGGGVFLVVWQDFRNGQDYDILAARVSPEGGVLDEKPIAVAATPRTQVLPDVASDGKAFLVVWQGLEGEETKYRGRAAIVGADGHIGDAIDTGAAAPQPRVAWGGGHYLVVFGAGHLSGIRVAPDGKPVDSAGSRIVVNWKDSTFSVGGAPGDRWLVLDHRSPPDYWGWGGPGAMRCYAVGKDGKPDAGIPKEESPQSRLPNWLDFGRDKKTGATWPMGESASAWDGKQFVAVWQRHHIEKTVMFKNCDLIATRVDGFKPLDEAGVPVAASDCEEKVPALASDGAGGLLCAYEKYGQDGKVGVCARTLKTE